MKKLFNSIPLSVSLPILYFLLGLVILFRFLAGSPIGALVSSLLLYVYASNFSAIEPLNASELVLWMDALNPDYKVALLASAVTIVGFIVAFHTATLNWKAQMKAELNAQAASDLEGFFARVHESMRNMTIYVQRLVDTISEIQSGCTADKALFNVQYALGQVEKYYESRRQLSAASVDIHGLIGRHHNVFASHWGVLESVRKTSTALSEVNEVMWVHIPIITPENTNPIQEFINQVNVSECMRFIEVCEQKEPALSGLPGGVRGRLLAPIVGFNFPMLLMLVRESKEVKEVLEKVKKSANSS